MSQVPTATHPIIGPDRNDDLRVVLFVRLQPGNKLADALRDRLKSALRAQASPRHVPTRILAVPEIPRTISGKIVELATSTDEMVVFYVRSGGLGQLDLTADSIA